MVYALIIGIVIGIVIGACGIGWLVRGAISEAVGRGLNW